MTRKPLKPVAVALISIVLTTVVRAEPNAFTLGGNQPDIHHMFLKTMFAVIIVLALAVAAVYACKKLGARIINIPGKQMQLLETMHLGPRKSVHLLKIGTHRILIGSTTVNITKLAVLDEQKDNVPDTETQ